MYHENLSKATFMRNNNLNTYFRLYLTRLLKTIISEAKKERVSNSKQLVIFLCLSVTVVGFFPMTETNF